MTEPSSKTIFLKDYQPPVFLIDSVDLHFELNSNATVVTSRMQMRRNPDRADGGELVLDGQELELLSVTINQQPLTADEYQLDDNSLTLNTIPDDCVVEIRTRIYPHNNTSLEGLYKSGDTYCTQCEAEGFRKITYFLDRPDVMATYTTTIEADQSQFPMLLSNGNPIDQGSSDNNRHWVRWQDPHRKPTYLFALVAGNLSSIEDSFTTQSGNQVKLRIYTEPTNIDKCDYAMDSLKRAMKWDEDIFGLEYDLDMFMIVATNDFNMGAMENKGLNIFNTKYVLASADTATDGDYQGIESVIGHEYFHNWTGNRVTCRDWFQLSLKEGLTVFRDQEFSADMAARSVQRIMDVNILRSSQYPEDAGPMAHPIRPESYEEISNFYTSTVYNKGAEVVRMYHTMLGVDGFRKGMDLYFQRHDGQAVTTEDFLAAMQDANEADLSIFQRWYQQAGTPRLVVETDYDEAQCRYRISVTQSCPDTPGQTNKQPFHIPLALGLLDASGSDMPLTVSDQAQKAPESTSILNITQQSQTFEFVDVKEKPVPSFLRGYSAPVQVCYDHSDQDLAFLLANDSDAYNRWDSGQQLSLRLMLSRVAARHNKQPDPSAATLIKGLGSALQESANDPAFFALTLTLPGESYAGEQMSEIDVDSIHHTRIDLKREIAQQLHTEIRRTYDDNLVEGNYAPTPQAMGKRQLRNLCLSYLAERDNSDVQTLCMQQFNNASNMTDSLGALTPLTNMDCSQRDEALMAFYERWKNDALVVDKWLGLQATSRLENTFDAVVALLDHPCFSMKNPNKVRALLGAFAHRNPHHFHRPDGAGYNFIADQTIALDRLNPQIAARLVSSLSRWRRYDSNRQTRMTAALERVIASHGLSKDVSEIVSKSLGG